MKIIRTKGRGARQTAEMLAALEQRGGAALDAVLPVVKRIVSDVRKKGDRALLRYAAQFDGLKDAASLRITPDEMAAAWEAVDPALREALSTAAEQIRAFAVSQLPASWSEKPIAGLTTGQLVRPLGSVGCYVPSGRHPLPSTLLMTAIPAQVAGVARIAVVSPKPAPETLAAAHLLGITEFYRLGGAHAVAALAYGTATIPRVDKIVGPGNLYVTAAKRLVAFDCAIDMLAGPTEAIVTSERGLAPDIALRPSMIPRRTTSSSPRAPIWRKRSSPKPNCAAAIIPLRVKRWIATAWLSSHRPWRKRTRLPIALRPSISPWMPPAMLTGFRMRARFSWVAGVRSRWATTFPAPITRCPQAVKRGCAAD
jgi:hypothetical protein